MSWKTPITSPTTQDFYNLFDNKVSSILVENFLTPAECKKMCQEILAIGLSPFDYDFHDEATDVHRVFDSHYLYEQKTPAEYFSKARESNANYQIFCQKIGFDPATRVKEYLSSNFLKPVSIAEQKGEQYTYALVRELKNSALLHADFAGYLDPIWSISDTIGQYAWNIYLSDPEDGGDSTIYNKPWVREDDQYILGDTYGYDHKVVEDKEYCSIIPKPGLLAFFNSRNFHEVNSSKAIRLSIGGHVGINHQQEIVMWI